MPRRSILSAAERDGLFAHPNTQDGLIQHYTLNESDLAIINQHRGPANRLGFAIQLCTMRYPGVMLSGDEAPFPPLLKLVATQLKVDEACWADYGQRDQTRREHLAELQSVFGFKPFAAQHRRVAVHGLDDLASQTDKGIVLATALIQSLRNQLILLSSINVIERICAEAVTRATRRIHTLLTESLTDSHRHQLDGLLNPRENSNVSAMIWLRQSPGALSARHVLEHIERLNAMEALMLPDGIERQIHQNRLLKLAREGGQMTAQHLRDLETTRRYATLVAVVLEARATVIDEIVDLHDRIIGTLFNRAKRNHEQQFQQSGKAINEKVRLYWRIGNALLEAKQAASVRRIVRQMRFNRRKWIGAGSGVQLTALPGLQGGPDDRHSCPHVRRAGVVVSAATFRHIMRRHLADSRAANAQQNQPARGSRRSLPCSRHRSDRSRLRQMRGQRWLIFRLNRDHLRLRIARPVSSFVTLEGFQSP